MQRSTSVCIFTKQEKNGSSFMNKREKVLFHQSYGKKSYQKLPFSTNWIAPYHLCGRDALRYCFWLQKSVIRRISIKGKVTFENSVIDSFPILDLSEFFYWIAQMQLIFESFTICNVTGGTSTSKKTKLRRYFSSNLRLVFNSTWQEHSILSLLRDIFPRRK